ncbi:Uncharacterised protein [Legionella pneumophila]|uniref:hypothetical protein n=1 Tax=Legionella pneumophila TaxID=446 RepID=UPI000770AFBA|nr:hypothetical protein [Legionella pneumophila]CZJ66370.1 Uncharacterised protein [Legionella pneumophila]CZR09020.1 Uncharacterised protein [Legionella pneumophila]
MSKQEHIISHNTDSSHLNTVMQQMKERIINEGDKPHVTVAGQDHTFLTSNYHLV